MSVAGRQTGGHIGSCTEIGRSYTTVAIAFSTRVKMSGAAEGWMYDHTIISVIMWGPKHLRGKSTDKSVCGSACSDKSHSPPPREDQGVPGEGRCL